MSEKRNDYISWDEYFMGVANDVSIRVKIRIRSRSLHCKWIIRFCSMGYNGLPNGCSDDELSVEKRG